MSPGSPAVGWATGDTGPASTTPNLWLAGEGEGCWRDPGWEMAALEGKRVARKHRCVN